MTVCFRVYGIVQGVGFRPTVDRHAMTAGIRGSVCNKGPYVEIIAQGTAQEIDCFRTLLQKQPPRRASILKIEEKPVPDAEIYDRFLIVESEKTLGEIYISPDIAICEECAQELYDPSNRRYLHPFINCTCCGPRLTILDALPYDRERTSMKMFPMCRQCAEEYHSPLSRRYDAQPVCCNECGPEVYLIPPAAARTDVRGAGKKIRGREAISAARRAILEGGIIAVKGIGGFHLCCDATNETAVHTLRVRKHRPAKPFAVMMRDEETVRRECFVNEEQHQILTGHQKPILLLDRKEGRLAPSVAPGNPKIGVMLPYAPLHMLLFTYDDGLQMPDCLIMTSGNVSGAPICRDDEDVLAELSGFCDSILSHDRLIRIRADDTVMDFHRGHPYMIRRSRGYAPLPVLLSDWMNEDNTKNVPAIDGKQREDFGQIRKEIDGLSNAPGRKGCVLAVGGELKNTFCIASGDLLYLSPYVGDLEDLRTVRALEETIGRMETLLEVTPQAVVCDLHPKYNSTAVAEEIAEKRGIPLYRIQHHYAHVLSCMAENDFPGPVIGASFDGTGFGTDQTIWGGEILVADAHGFTREYSIAPFLQTGGDSAPRQGWRIAASLIWDFCKKEAYKKGASKKEASKKETSKKEACNKKAAVSRENADTDKEGTDARKQTEAKEISDAQQRYFHIMEALSICDRQNAGVQRMMAERGIQAVQSTSAGRLFDAVSAMLGICRESTFEGEAATLLEFAAERYMKRRLASDSFTEENGLPKNGSEKAGSAADSGPESCIAFPEDSPYLPTDLLFASLLERRLDGEDPEKLAYDFHLQLAAFIAEAILRTSAKTGIRTAALTGGCFQNRLLLSLVEDCLADTEIEVLIHHLVPPNDGGIALGQAAAVLARMRKENTEAG